MILMVKFYLPNVCKSRSFWGGFSLLNLAAEKFASAVDHIALRLWLMAVSRASLKVHGVTNLGSKRLDIQQC